MRGLTDQELAVLLAPKDEVCDPDIVDRLVARGLMTLVGTDELGELWLANESGLRAARLAKAARPR